MIIEVQRIYDEANPEFDDLKAYFESIEEAYLWTINSMLTDYWYEITSWTPTQRNHFFVLVEHGDFSTATMVWNQYSDNWHFIAKCLNQRAVPTQEQIKKKLESVKTKKAFK